MTVKSVIVGGRFFTNCYIVSDGKGAGVVIDPGSDDDIILAEAEKLGVKVGKILLTHGHNDHTGAVKALAKATGAAVYIGRADEYRLHFKADVLLDGGESISEGELSFKVLAAPGHTQGGVCYICGGYLFSGDTLFSGSIGRTDLEGGDFALLVQSLKKLGELPGDYTVLPGHEQATTLARERQYNRFMR